MKHINNNKDNYDNGFSEQEPDYQEPNFDSNEADAFQNERAPRGTIASLKMKWATGLMVLGSMFSLGQGVPTASAAPKGNKQKTTKVVKSGKMRQMASKAAGKLKRGASNSRDLAKRLYKRVSTKASGEFALLNKYKQDLAKYGREKLEGYQKNMTGVASWYGGYFHGRLTASGRRYSKFSYMAAHKSLPFGTLMRVTNPDNGKSVVVEILDRGPYVADRMLDLSEATAKELGYANSGVATVKTEILKMGDLPYEVEKPFNAAEMSGASIRHTIDLSGIEGGGEMASNASAQSSTAVRPQFENNSFSYQARFSNLMTRLQSEMDAVATSARESLATVYASATPA